MILGIRTDKPSAELYLIDKGKAMDQIVWQADRRLSDELLQKIEELLGANSLDKNMIEALVVYEGPGSFTGLRIGMAVANSLAYSLDIPIVAARGDDWLLSSASGPINSKTFDKPAAPKYGQAARITKPRK